MKMTLDEILAKDTAIKESAQRASEINQKFTKGFFSKIKYAMIIGPVMEKRKKFAVNPTFSVGGGKLTADAEERLEADFMRRMKDSSLTEKGTNPEKMKDAQAAIRSFLETFSVVGDLSVLAESSDKEELYTLFAQAKENGATHVSDFVQKFYERTYGSNIEEKHEIRSLLENNQNEDVLSQENTVSGPKA